MEMFNEFPQGVKEQFEENRVKMLELKANFRKLFWFSLILGGIWFGTSFFVGAVSTMDEDIHGPFKFYTAMGTGVAQILLAIATLLFGWLAARGSRIASLLVMGIYTVCLFIVMLHLDTSLVISNIPLLCAGLALHVWAQMLFSRDEVLKEQPGYPIFSIKAATKAQFMTSPDVSARARKAGDTMESVGGETVKEVRKEPVLQAVSQDTTLSDMYANRVPGQAPAKLGPISLETQTVAYQPRMTQTLPDPVFADAGKPAEPAPTPAAPSPVTLEQFDAAMQQTVQKPQVHPEMLPQVTAEELLGDMSALGSGRNYQPHEELLPSPEEVKRRLAAMKQARQQE